MPTYVYRFVKTGETIEVAQSFTDAPLTQAVNPRTGRKMAVKKVITPVGVTFRGDGFYKTDSRASKKKAGATNGASSASTSSDSSSGDKAAAGATSGDKAAAGATSGDKSASTTEKGSATTPKPAASPN